MHIYTISSKGHFKETVQAEWCELNITMVTLVQSSCFFKGLVN